MENNWSLCKNILIIRPDNVGDLIMSGPAIRALKQTFEAKITVLTSSMATPVAKVMDEIDEIITYDFPWVKIDNSENNSTYGDIIKQLQDKNFDGVVIFTVYSQNPMPTIMLAYMAGIPKRLAYCRENPYKLLTDWVPDEEPYTFIRHQVKRDIDLVASVGAYITDENLDLRVNRSLWSQIEQKLISLGYDTTKKWLILHAGVSEIKRQFPIEAWVKIAKQLIEKHDYQVVLTGSASEKPLTDLLQLKIGQQSFSTGGIFAFTELITLISHASIMLSVNTGTVHIAAAVGTPVVVLYALTNPQHTPWKVPSQVLPYQVSDDLHSKNEVIKYVNHFYYREQISIPSPTKVVEAAIQLLQTPEKYLNNESSLIELMQ